MNRCLLLMGLLMSLIFVNAQNSSMLDRDVVLYDQAQYVTDSSVMPEGCHLSRLQGTQNALGTYANWNIDHGQTSLLADDFIIDEPVVVTGFEVYAYQTDSDTTSSFTGLYCQIYDGNPMEGGEPIWGSMSENVISETGFTRCYRSNDYTNTTRPLMYIRAAELEVSLEPGQYWLVWTLQGSLSSGPWALPRTLVDEVNTGDALQKTSAGWTPLIDGGSNTSYGMAMQVLGYNVGPQPREISANVFPEEAGFVEGTGIYMDTDTCTLIATPSEEKYHFYHWLEADTIASEVDTFSFVVDHDRMFTACFYQDSIMIDATVEPEFGGTIASGIGNYVYGDECTLVAVALEGYHFVEWHEADTLVSDTPEFTFVVTEPRSFVAVFERETYLITLEAEPADYGTVMGGGSFLYGDVCTITASPFQYRRFVCWTVDADTISYSPVYTFEVAGPSHIVGHFEMNTYEITAIAVPEEGGTINGTGTYLYGENAVLMAASTGAYSFLNWMEDGIIISTSSTITFPVTGPRSLIANFAQGTAAVTATVNPDESGSVEGAGNFIIGTTCTLKATANSGYEFVNWTENGNVVSEEVEYSFIVPGDRSLVANFTKQTFNIAVSQNPQVGGIISGAGSYLYGAQAILKARANDDYEFVNWTENGMVISSEPTYSFTVVSNREFVANFIEKIVYYTIDISSDNDEGGMVIGGGEFQAGQRCTLNAIPYEGYTFRNWTEYGNIVSNMTEYSFDVERSRTLVAHFTKKVYTITAVAASNGTITPSGTIQIEHGASQLFTITPDPSYKVKKVVVDGVDWGAVLEYEFTNVTSDHTIHATFEQEGAVAEAGETIQIYPNPTHDAVLISGDNIAEVLVYDIQGRQLERVSMTGTEMHLDLSSYEPGLYVVKMCSNNGASWQQRVVRL